MKKRLAYVTALVGHVIQREEGDPIIELPSKAEFLRDMALYYEKLCRVNCSLMEGFRFVNGGGMTYLVTRDPEQAALGALGDNIEGATNGHWSLKILDSP